MPCTCNDKLNQTLYRSNLFLDPQIGILKNSVTNFFHGSQESMAHENYSRLISRGTTRIFLRWNLIWKIGEEWTVERAREEGKRGTEKSAGVHGQKHEARGFQFLRARATCRKNASRPTIPGKKGHCVFSLSHRTSIHGCLCFAFATKFVTKKIQWELENL